MSWHAATIHESTDGLLGSGHLPRSSRAGRPRRSITDSTASTTWPCATGAMMSAGAEKIYTISGTNRTRVAAQTMRGWVNDYRRGRFAVKQMLARHAR